MRRSQKQARGSSKRGGVLIELAQALCAELDELQRKHSGGYPFSLSSARDLAQQLLNQSTKGVSK